MQLTFKSRKPHIKQFHERPIFNGKVETPAEQYEEWVYRKSVEIESVDVSSDGKIITVLYSEIG